MVTLNGVRWLNKSQPQAASFKWPELLWLAARGLALEAVLDENTDRWAELGRRHGDGADAVPVLETAPSWL
ncbi:hypothetical protein PSEUDO8Z_10255 [Pseudomonas sp. 8Z]|nr:hypothetical protein PSEUDO8Z_10255 [Pseudomonas sp. 8Z]